MEIAFHARTSRTTRTTRAVQARRNAVGHAMQDTSKVAGIVTYMKMVMIYARQESTSSLVHASNAQTSQIMLITPATADQAQLAAYGIALLDIIGMKSPVHITHH
jgi:hypothetical protein